MKLGGPFALDWKNKKETFKSYIFSRLG